MLEKYIRVREQLKPYIAELSANVTARGVPTMRKQTRDSLLL